MATAILTDSAFAAKVDAQENVYRWRVSWKRELYASEFEETDAIGRVSMSCLALRGVEVTVLMRGEQLRAFGDLIARGIYPKVKVDGDGEAGFLIDKLMYTELPGGWQYSFSGPIDTPAMAHFEQTGTLNFEIEGGVKDGVSLDRGLDAIAEFRSRCRRPRQ